MYAYTPDNFKLILKIFTTYTALAEQHISLLEDSYQLSMTEDILSADLDMCKNTLKRVDEDREFMYKQRERDIKKLQRVIKKNNLKLVLISGGTGIVGIGIGILIGVFGV